MQESLDSRRNEFRSHVWDHSADVFQQSFDERRPLKSDELEALIVVVNAICQGSDDSEVAGIILQQLNDDEQNIDVFLQLVGLTRNKIISDLKASAQVRVTIPSSHRKLYTKGAVWDIAGPYLASRLRNVLAPLCASSGSLAHSLEALNQATWPGWIRQERAKRQGHEAEYRLATIYSAASIPFQPEAKADNPLSGDLIINGVSFDLVVGSVESPLVCVKSTVHTSNIGQYGESKDALEMAEARNMIDSNYSAATAPVLLALIDGVGFFSNSAGLNGVLSSSSEFCQFRTLWKAVVLASYKLGRGVLLALPKQSIEFHADFLDRYRSAVSVEVINDHHRARLGTHNAIEAGDGIVIS
jgi:hypothetical protein